MLDRDLAELYSVETKRLNEQVKRNSQRFPEDFMFQITTEEFNSLRSHFATTNFSKTRTLPYAFTRNGFSMLSSVLNSDEAIEVNIRIMRIFSQWSEMIGTHADLLHRMEQIEKQGLENKKDIAQIFAAIRQLQGFQEAGSSKKIGF